MPPGYLRKPVGLFRFRRRLHRRPRTASELKITNDRNLLIDAVIVLAPRPALALRWTSRRNAGLIAVLIGMLGALLEGRTDALDAYALGKPDASVC